MSGEARATWAAPVAAADSDGALELLEQAIASNERFPARVHHWLHIGLVEFAKGERPLAECLALTPAAGERSFAHRLAQARRTRAVIELWRGQDGVEGLSTWRRCEILAVEVLEFDADFWPSWSVDGVPAGASRRRTLLYDAFAAMGTPPPMTAKGMHELLTRAKQTPGSSSILRKRHVAA